MEASAVKRAAPATGAPKLRLPARLLALVSDERLVAGVRAGSERAFEAMFDRYERGLLTFCRHMLGSVEEAEDAVQHVFLAAYRGLAASDRAIELRPWLYTIARNRCLSVLRARRESPAGTIDGPGNERGSGGGGDLSALAYRRTGSSGDGSAPARARAGGSGDASAPAHPRAGGSGDVSAEVERREELRELLADVARLPDDQRAALVLAEVGAMPHEEIAAVLGVRREKVKALVFQARSSLIASRAGRETPCAEIREQLAAGSGGDLRRTALRRHLRDCPGCRAFRAEVRDQRRLLGLALPVAPSAALKEAALAGIFGGGGGAAAGGGIAAGGGGALAVKALTVALLAGGGTAGVEAIRAHEHPAPARSVATAHHSASVPASLRHGPLVGSPLPRGDSASRDSSAAQSSHPTSTRRGHGDSSRRRRDSTAAARRRRDSKVAAAHGRSDSTVAARRRSDTTTATRRRSTSTTTARRRSDTTAAAGGRSDSTAAARRRTDSTAAARRRTDSTTALRQRSDSAAARQDSAAADQSDAAAGGSKTARE